jgi:hypothetical protein
MQEIDKARAFLKAQAIVLEDQAQAKGRNIKFCVVYDDAKAELTLVVRFCDFDVMIAMRMWDQGLFFDSAYVTAVNAVFVSLESLIEANRLQVLSLKRALVAPSN